MKQPRPTIDESQYALFSFVRQGNLMALRAAREQLKFLLYDATLLINKRWWRFWTVPFCPSFIAVAAYRIDRFLYLALGRVWTALRIILSPLSLIVHPWIGSRGEL